MSSKDVPPAEPPPSYAASQVASQNTGTSTTSQPSRASHLEVPQAQNGIPVAARKSMEDEGRKLPAGWIRQFDATESHQFFVDTKATPPRSIWHHPYDDEQFLSTLTSEEREAIQAQEETLKRPVTPVSYDEKANHKASLSPNESFPGELPPRPGRTASTDAGSKQKKKSFGEKFKEKATGMTKEERAVEKQRRAEEERQYYEMHLKYRNAMAQAARTGQPVFLDKDRDGHDIYVEPPNYGYGGGYGGYGQGGYGVNPYSSGIYSNPNARFVRPQAAYGRPYGGGYGGGYGLGLPLAGGLLGGALLGAALF